MVIYVSCCLWKKLKVCIGKFLTNSSKGVGVGEVGWWHEGRHSKHIIVSWDA